MDSENRKYIEPDIDAFGLQWNYFGRMIYVPLDFQRLSDSYRT